MSGVVVTREMIMARWTFITNHGAVLAFVAEHGRITAREMALQLGITERSVLRIISDLEAEGYLTRIRDGRANRYLVDPNLPLRRRERQDIAVGEVLQVLLRGEKG